MKINYKILLLVFITFSYTSLNAQITKPRKLRGDFRIGVNFAEMDIPGGNMFKVPKIGAQFGGTMSYKVLGDFQVQTGFFVTKKGLKQKENTYDLNQVTGVTTIVDRRRWVDANYAQMPFNIGFEHYFTTEFALNINGGLYLAYGFKGLSNVYGTITTIAGTETSIYVLDSGDQQTFNLTSLGQLKRFDYGMGLNIGAIYDIYGITIGYEYGLHNISAVAGDIRRNRNFNIGLGFRF